MPQNNGDHAIILYIFFCGQDGPQINAQDSAVSDLKS